MSLELDCRADRIASLEDFVAFLEEYSKDMEQAPDEWVNKSTAAFLEAMSAWIGDSKKNPNSVGHEILRVTNE